MIVVLLVARLPSAVNAAKFREAVTTKSTTSHMMGVSRSSDCASHRRVGVGDFGGVEGCGGITTIPAQSGTSPRS
jgi:hypothetical protein